MHLPHRSWTLLLVAVIALTPFLVGCSDDDADNARERVEGAIEDAEDAVGTGSAMAVAGALQGAIEADERAADEGPRSVAVLEENIDDLPGDPEVVGVEDADGDGVDDDGKVEVRVEDQAACLTLGEVGEGVDIGGESCD